jgi:cell shape-determining protein MreD
MNSIWNNLYDKFKDRRYGVLFFSSLIAVFVVFLLGAFLYNILGGIDFGPFDVQAHFLELVPGIIILMVALIWRVVRQARMRRGKRYRREELSRDEIRQARSKLVNRNKI